MLRLLLRGSATAAIPAGLPTTADPPRCSQLSHGMAHLAVDLGLATSLIEQRVLPSLTPLHTAAPANTATTLVPDGQRLSSPGVDGLRQGWHLLLRPNP